MLQLRLSLHHPRHPPPPPSRPQTPGPTGHFERSRPTPFPFTFAPVNESACAERNLSSPRLSRPQANGYHSPSIPFDHDLVEAQLALQRIGTTDMPKLAWDALEAGLDGPATRRLAALHIPTFFELNQILPGAWRRSSPHLPLRHPLQCQHLALLRAFQKIKIDLLLETRGNREQTRCFLLLCPTWVAFLISLSSTRRAPRPCVAIRINSLALPRTHTDPFIPSFLILILNGSMPLWKNNSPSSPHLCATAPARTLSHPWPGNTSRPSADTFHHSAWA